MGPEILIRGLELKRPERPGASRPPEDTDTGAGAFGRGNYISMDIRGRLEAAGFPDAVIERSEGTVWVGVYVSPEDPDGASGDVVQGVWNDLREALEGCGALEPYIEHDYVGIEIRPHG